MSGARSGGATARPAGRWRRLARGLAVVAAGLFPFALGVVFTLLSGLGNGPWQVLSEGLTRHLPLSFGLATTLVGLLNQSADGNHMLRCTERRGAACCALGRWAQQAAPLRPDATSPNR
jgi:hypothetical protein